MTQKRTPHRRKLADDPLVPISGAHVQALLRLAGLSEREAVRALRRRGVQTAQGTLDHIIQGRQSRCRASLRNGLASLFAAGLPAEWLGGGVHGSAIHRAVARAREHHGLAVGGLLDLGADASPLYELVAYRLKHDLEEALFEQPKADKADPVRLVGLLSLGTFREWLLSDPTAGIVGRDEADRFAAAMGEALHVALQPWLEGKSTVREDRLLEVQAAVARVTRDIAVSGDVPRTGAVGGRWERPDARGEKAIAPPVFDRQYLDAKEAELKAGESGRRAERRARRQKRLRSPGHE